jgi:hypothetical protein
MTMQYDGSWSFWSDIMQYVLTLLIGAYAWMTRRAKKTDQRLDTLEDEIGKRALASLCLPHMERTLRIETDLAHMPNHATIASLSQRIERLNGQLERLSGRLDGVNRAVDLVNEFLINQGGKS